MEFLAIIPILLFFIIAFGGTILWIWMLIDCITKEPSEGNDKLIWILVIVFTGVIGAAIYYFVRRPERIQNFGQ